MQSPIIFLATADRSFERIAVDAIIASQHGARRACEIREACRLLGEGTGDIALAILDLDLRGHGIDLLRIITGSDPSFPILVIADDALTIMQDESITAMATACLIKPVKAENLARVIRDLCLQAPPEACEHPGAPYGREAIGRALHSAC